MKFRDLRHKFNNKFTIIVLCISLIIFLSIFVTIKNEFYYSSINYINYYLDYYIANYLKGNVFDLIVDGRLLLYIENDLANIFSSLYIYVVSFGSNIFNFFSFISPFIIFYKVSSWLHDELYDKASIPKITRVGLKKYINSSIIVNGIYFGLILFIPRFLYLLILSLFFPIGISSTHYISYSSFISQAFLYVGYNCNPFILILVDLLMSFLYGAVITFISTIIVSFIKNKPLSYLIFMFVLGILSLLPTFLRKTPFIFYISLFNYYNYSNETITKANISIPIIILFIFSILCYFVSKIILRKKVQKNI